MSGGRFAGDCSSSCRPCFGSAAAGRGSFSAHRHGCRRSAKEKDTDSQAKTASIPEVKERGLEHIIIG